MCWLLRELITGGKTKRILQDVLKWYQNLLYKKYVINDQWSNNYKVQRWNINV